MKAAILTKYNKEGMDLELRELPIPIPEENTIKWQLPKTRRMISCLCMKAASSLKKSVAYLEKTIP